MYLHTPLVLAADGEKLSKQNGAQPLAVASQAQALSALQDAANTLQLQASHAQTCAQALAEWVMQWRDKWGMSA
jgi:glutamyl-Q tRNA(Asp) synthetase